MLLRLNGCRQSTMATHSPRGSKGPCNFQTTESYTFYPAAARARQCGIERATSGNSLGINSKHRIKAFCSSSKGAARRPKLKILILTNPNPMQCSVFLTVGCEVRLSYISHMRHLRHHYIMLQTFWSMSAPCHGPSCPPSRGNVGHARSSTSCGSCP